MGRAVRAWSRGARRNVGVMLDLDVLVVWNANERWVVAQVQVSQLMVEVEDANGEGCEVVVVQITG